MSFEFVNNSVVDIEQPQPLPPINMPPPLTEVEGVTVSAIGGTPTGPAGGVLSGSYPNPGFSGSMVTVDRLNQTLGDHVNSETPHPVYDDMASLTLIFENGLI